MLFTLFDFEWKDRFWISLVQKVKIISWSWNLVPALIQKCKIQWCCLLFLFFSGNKKKTKYSQFGPNCPKRVFPLKNKKTEQPYWILHIWISVGTKFQLQLIILTFGLNLPQKDISNQKQTNEYHHWILHVRIIVGTKFQFKVRILIFWTKFAQKGYFHWKTKKVNSIIEFCVFKLV